MKTMRIAPSFRYQLRDFLLGFAPFFGCLVLVLAASLIYSVNRSGGGVITYSGFGVASMICVFVFGIVSPRPGLRLGIQLGVSRRTAFVSQLLALVVSVLAMAAAGEVLSAVGQVFNQQDNLFLRDIYQIIYLDESVEALNFVQHVCSGLFNAVWMLFAFAGGMFFTFLFWRLNKLWTVVVAIAIPVLLNVVPMLFYRAAQLSEGVRRAGEALLAFLGRSSWNLMGFSLLLTVIFTVFSWLLVRRANIRAPQSK